MSIETREPEHRPAAILAFVIVWWVTEAIPIPVTALLARMLKAGAVFDIIGAVLCVVGVSVMANVVGLV